MADQNSKTVVIAEDDSGIRKLIAETLQDTGFETIQAANGMEALNIINGRYNESQQIDLLITDIKMPHIDGLTLIEELEKIGIFLPVLVLTGHGDRELLIKLIRNGCRDYLDKPFRLDELLNHVVNVIHRAEEANLKIAGYLSRIKSVKTGESSPVAAKRIRKGVALRQVKEWKMIDIVGELTEDTATSLRSLGDEIVDSGTVKLLINLSASGYFGSYGMGVIVYLWKRVAELKGQLVLVTGETRVRQKIEELNLSRVMRIFDSEQDFISAMTEGWLTI